MGRSYQEGETCLQIPLTGWSQSRRRVKARGLRHREKASGPEPFAFDQRRLSDAPDLGSNAQGFCSGASNLYLDASEFCSGASKSFSDASDLCSDAREFCSDASKSFSDTPNFCFLDVSGGCHLVFGRVRGFDDGMVPDAIRPASRRPKGAAASQPGATPGIAWVAPLALVGHAWRRPIESIGCLGDWISMGHHPAGIHREGRGTHDLARGFGAAVAASLCGAASVSFRA